MENTVDVNSVYTDWAISHPVQWRFLGTVPWRVGHRADQMCVMTPDLLLRGAQDLVRYVELLH